MKGILHELAAAAAAARHASFSEATLEKALCHTLDSLGVMLAGAQTGEARATRVAFRRMAGPLHRARIPENPLYTAAILTSACRLTECDDIHIASCTTPGSVVFAAVLAADSVVASPPERVLEGIIAGYDVMTALGTAARGPEVVYGDLWPSYLAAAMTAAAAAGKVMALSEEALRRALAIAATMTTGIAGRITAEPTSRWLTLGCAVQNGLIAASAAEAGMQGDEAVLERVWEPLRWYSASEFSAMPAETRKTCLDRVSLKPFCTSRQGLAATQAFMSLLADEPIEPASIDAIEVVVPSQYRSMLDRSKRPRTKNESRGIHYQLAIAALHPGDLYDIERAYLRTADAQVCALIDRIRVVASDSLTMLYPRIWAGAVRVTAGQRTYEREVLHPKGDPEQPMSRADIVAKIASMAGFLPYDIPTARLERAIWARDFQEALALLFENERCWA